MRIKKGRGDVARRVMIYGPHGIGKSTFAASFPRPIVLDTEGGCEEIGVDRTPTLKSLDEFLEAVGIVSQSDGAGQERLYETIIVDSLDWLERLVHQKTCDRMGWKAIDNTDYGSRYLATNVEWKTVIDALSWANTELGKRIVLVAHAKNERYNDPLAEPYDRWTINIHRIAAALISEWCSEIHFAGWATLVDQAKDGARKRNRALQQDRVLYCQPGAGYVAKERIGLPASMPLVGATYHQMVNELTGKDRTNA